MKISLLCLVFSVPFVRSIIGGKDTDVKSYTFVVSIRKAGRYYTPICSGALIEWNFVLTAATCVKDIRLEDLYVMANVTDANDSRQGIRIYIDKIIRKNATGRNSVRNNIALLRIKNHYDLNDIYPRRWDGENLAKEGEQCYFLGWGQTYVNTPGGTVTTNTLQVATTTISNLTSCRLENSDVDDTNICTYNARASLCEFDAGAPLICQSLLGIATEQHSCGGLIEDVYTRVYSHKDWIEKVVNRSTDHKPQKIVTGIIVVLMLLIN